jgi:carboxylesterase type B
MTIQNTGTRRAILKASVAIATMTAAGGILAACGEPTPAEPVVDPNPVVETKHGKVKGALENGIATFKGVRYGADTTLTRFQLPKPPEAWTETQDALAYPTSAPQPQSGDGGGLFASWRPNPPLSAGEDCLFLNVWTPAADGKKRPVLVWFHGGGFTTGSGSSYAYDGVNLAKRGDVVVVTTNHRLNQFGYLNLAAYGDEFADSGAVGAHDMILSLEWVRDNIEAFGGDPANVLIFGESGGGSKVCTLMAMDKAKGLFHRAVVQSGPRINHATKEASAKAADEVVKKLGLTKETIGEIFNKTVAEIQAASEGVVGAGSGPVLDGRSIARDPFNPDGPPQSADVPLLIGCNRTEGTSLTSADSPNHSLTWETLPAADQDCLPVQGRENDHRSLQGETRRHRSARTLLHGDRRQLLLPRQRHGRRPQGGPGRRAGLLLPPRLGNPGHGRQALRTPRPRHRHGVRQRRQVGEPCPARGTKPRRSPTRCPKAGSPSPRPATPPTPTSPPGPPTQQPNAT